LGTYCWTRIRSAGPNSLVGEWIPGPGA